MPELWGKYASSNFIIKTLRDNVPLRLNEHLKKTLRYEKRQENKLKFF